MANKKSVDEVAKTVVVHLRFPEALWRKLEVLAAQEDETVNSYLRLIARDHVRDVEKARGEVIQGFRET